MSPARIIKLREATDAVLKAIGVDPRLCKAVTIKLTPYEATVEIVRFLDDFAARDLALTLQRFDFVLRPTPQLPSASDGDSS